MRSYCMNFTRIKFAKSEMQIIREKILFEHACVLVETCIIGMLP